MKVGCWALGVLQNTFVRGYSDRRKTTAVRFLPLPRRGCHVKVKRESEAYCGPRSPVKVAGLWFGHHGAEESFAIETFGGIEAEGVVFPFRAGEVWQAGSDGCRIRKPKRGKPRCPGRPG